MSNLKQILIDRFNNNCLAHFYIIEPRSDIDDQGEFLANWIQDLLKNMTGSAQLESIQNNPDILFVGHMDFQKAQQAQIKDYLLEDFQEFFKFLELKSFFAAHRFIIIADAHRIGERLANKLLKSLEEPGEKITIFLLNPKTKSLLPTINSRGIRLSINSSNRTDLNKKQLKNIDEKIQWFQNNLHADLQKIVIPLLKGDSNPIDLIEKIQADPKLEPMLLNSVISWESSSSSDFTQKEKLLNYLKWHQQSKTFHNSLQERVASLISLLR